MATHPGPETPAAPPGALDAVAPGRAEEALETLRRTAPPSPPRAEAFQLVKQAA